MVLEGSREGGVEGGLRQDSARVGQPRMKINSLERRSPCSVLVPCEKPQDHSW